MPAQTKRRPKHQGELGAFWLVESQNGVSLEVLIRDSPERWPVGDAGYVKCMKYGTQLYKFFWKSAMK